MPDVAALPGRSSVSLDSASMSGDEPRPVVDLGAGVRRRWFGIIGLLALLVLTLAASILLGSRDVGLSTIWHAFTDYDRSSAAETVSTRIS